MLTVGTYKTRDGRDVKIVAIENDIAIGVLEGNPRRVAAWDAKTGSFYFDHTLLDRMDIVEADCVEGENLD